MDRNGGVAVIAIVAELGQARKSLWIETFQVKICDLDKAVRLVRACGLRFNWRKEMWIPGIRDRQMKSVSRN